MKAANTFSKECTQIYHKHTQFPKYPLQPLIREPDHHLATALKIGRRESRTIQHTPKPSITLPHLHIRSRLPANFFFFSKATTTITTIRCSKGEKKNRFQKNPTNILAPYRRIHLQLFLHAFSLLHKQHTHMHLRTTTVLYILVCKPNAANAFLCNFFVRPT